MVSGGAFVNNLRHIKSLTYKSYFLTLFRTVAASVRDAVNDCTSALSTLRLHSLTARGGLAEGQCFHRGARQVSG